MNVCVITDDRMIQIDGEAINFDFTIDANIHAIEWNGSTGNVQFKDNTPNEEFTEITAYQSLVDAHAAEKQRLVAFEIQKEVDRISNMTYADKRSVEYPSIIEQLDDIYHNGIVGWSDAIKVIKDKYPKN